jgi:hypothetical protein
MPRDIEDANDATMVLLDGACDGKGWHVAAKAIVPYPRIGKQVTIIRYLVWPGAARRPQDAQ